MTTAAAEAIHNARLSERLRIAELAEERAMEIEASLQGRRVTVHLVDDARARVAALRAFAAELRGMT